MGPQTPAPQAAIKRSAERRAADTATAGAASSSACRARRTSMNSPAAVWSHASAANERRPAHPAPRGPPETMAQESPSVPRLPQRKILAQRFIKRLISHEQPIVHSRSPRACAKLFNMRLHLRAIGCLRILGNDFDLLIGFKINQQRRPLQYRTDLLRIENMKQHHIVAMEAQRLDGAHNLLRLLIEIRDHDRNAASMQQLLEMLQRLTEVRPRSRLRLFQSRKKSRKLALPCRWPYVLPHLIIEDDHPRRIALVSAREIEERRRNKR